MNLQESRIEALQNIAKLSRSVRCFVADLFLCCKKEKNVVHCNHMSKRKAMEQRFCECALNNYCNTLTEITEDRP